MQAGLLVAETEFALQVESDIAPYKGLLMGLFFMTVGMEISVGLFFAEWKTVVSGIFLLIAGKVKPASNLHCVYVAVLLLTSTFCARQTLQSLVWCCCVLTQQKSNAAKLVCACVKLKLLVNVHNVLLVLCLCVSVQAQEEGFKSKMQVALDIKQHDHKA